MSGEVGALRITIGLNAAGVSTGIKSLNQSLNALNSEYKAISVGSAKFDNSLDTLRARSDVLTRTMQTHQRKVEELSRKYEESKATKGEDAAETLRLASAYNNAVSAMNRTEQQLSRVNEQIQEQTNSFSQLEREVNSNVDSITRQMRVLESGYAAAAASAGDLEGSVEGLQQRQEHLNQAITLHQRRVNELTRLYQESARSKGEDATETQELAVRLNRATQTLNETQSQLNQTTNAINEQTNAWQNASQVIEQTGDALSEAGQNAQDAGTALSAGISAPLLGFGAAAAMVADGFDSSAGRIEARLGVTAERAEELADIGEEVWKDAFGESVKDAADSITLVSNNLGKISDKELKQATESAYFLREAFDAEINESTRAAGQLMKDFGDSSSKAFDILTYGFQNGLDYTGEFLDTIREYSPQFAELGYNSEQFLNSLKAGFDAGAWSLDKIGDSIKESHLRMSDLSEVTKDAYKAMGLNATEYINKISKGGEEGNKAFQEIVKKLMEVDDATQRNALSTALFGTQYEDLREKVIFAIAGASREIKGLEGTTKRASDALYNNFGTRFQRMWRDLQSDLKPIGEQVLNIAEKALPKLADTVGKVTGAFAKLSPETQSTIIEVGAIATVAGPAIVAIGGIASTIGTVTKVVAPFVASIGANGLTGALSGLLGPVGLVITGLGLAAGAGIAMKNAIDESKEASLNHAKSLIEQQQSLESLTGKYEALREKNQLSNYELLRFRDLQKELQTAKSAEEIAKLRDEAEKLREKSGLTNDEMSEMLELNDKLIERVPEAGQAFSDQGQKILKNADDLHEANNKLRENIQLELELQKTKAEAKLDENIRDQIESLEELNEKIIELNNAKIEAAAKEYQLNEMIKQQQQAYKDGQTAIAESMEMDIQRLQQELEIQNQSVGAIATEVQEKQKAVDKTTEQITKTQELYNETINLQLASAGINATGQEGIEQLDQAIQKSLARKFELLRIQEAQGGLNEEQQKELDNLDSSLEKYRAAKGSIDEIQQEQIEVNKKIDEGKVKAGEMSDVLSASEVKDIQFTGDGYTEAKIISDEASRRVLKEINATDYGKTHAIHAEAEKSATKKVTLNAVWTGVSAALKAALPNFFAKGSRNTPEGLAIVGEEGPELIHLPQGAKVIPNRDTEAILRNWNIPMLASGGVTLTKGMVYAGERGREILDLRGALTTPLPSSSSSPVNGKPAIIQIVTPEKRELARWLVDDISEFQEFNLNRFK